MFACPACCPRSSVPLSAHRCFFLFLCLFEWMYFTFSTFCAIFAVWPSYIFTLSLSMAGNSNFLKCQCIVSGVGVHFLNPAMVNNIRLFEINHHFCLTKWSKCFEPCHYFLKFSYLSPFGCDIFFVHKVNRKFPFETKVQKDCRVPFEMQFSETQKRWAAALR